MSILEADHARIVAEATAEARAAERRHWEARFRNAEQAHAAALAGSMDECAWLWNEVDRWIDKYYTDSAPRTLTADENYMRGLTDARAAVDAVGRWRSFPDDTLLSRAAVLAAIDALIHDGGAA